MDSERNKELMGSVLDQLAATAQNGRDTHPVVHRLAPFAWTVMPDEYDPEEDYDPNLLFILEFEQALSHEERQTALAILQGFAPEGVTAKLEDYVPLGFDFAVGFYRQEQAAA